jgi:CRP/FNR family transcriptional regulator, nitrogen fixation regulation protein
MKNRIHAADYYRRMLASQPHPLGTMDDSATIVFCDRSREVPTNTGASDHLYYVITGAVRRCAMRSDGRRQIVDLMLPSDFFFVCGGQNETTAEPTKDTVLASYPGWRVELLSERDPSVARELRKVALQSLTRSQAQLLILGHVTALEKVGSFLLWLVDRAPNGSGQVTLPVSRYDMADYLALSVETVCRSLTDLRHRGVIALADKRTIRILNRNALENGECLPSSGRHAPDVATAA